jgi:4'-phosphopantetheinyl transferase
MRYCSWPLGPARPELGTCEAHVWAAPLDLQEATVASLHTTLSEDERQRAARFRLGQLRNRFVAARAALRAILARYLEAMPEELRFNYAERGKPSLAGPWAERGLCFNLAHSQGLALFAVTRMGDVGVDVEQIRHTVSMDRLVERFFSAEEQDQWRRLPAETRQLAFFHAWTRKEAWLKATGSGLSFPLEQISVSLTPGKPARVLSINGSVAEAARWWLDSFEPGPGWIGALALRGPAAEVQRWQFGF